MKIAVYENEQGRLQVNLENGTSGYRLLGPTFTGLSQPVCSQELTEQDIARLRQILGGEGERSE